MKLTLTRRIKYITVEPKIILLAGVFATLQQVIEELLKNNIHLYPILFIAMFVDLVAGVTRAVLNKEAVVSKGLRKTIVKCIQYCCFLALLMIIAICYRELFPTHNTYILTLYKFGVLYLILIEAKSINENIRGNKDLPSGTVSKLINGLLTKIKINKNNTNTNNK